MIAISPAHRALKPGVDPGCKDYTGERTEADWSLVFSLILLECFRGQGFQAQWFQKPPSTIKVTGLGQLIHQLNQVNPTLGIEVHLDSVELAPGERPPDRLTTVYNKDEFLARSIHETVRIWRVAQGFSGKGVLVGPGEVPEKLGRRRLGWQADARFSTVLLEPGFFCHPRFADFIYTREAMVGLAGAIVTGYVNALPQVPVPPGPVDPDRPV